MKTRKIVSAAVFVLASGVLPAGAQLPRVAVDIQCKFNVGPGRTQISSQSFGANNLAVPYWNCNVPMPYENPPDRWVCINSAVAGLWDAFGHEIGGNGGYVNLRHNMPGHDYHQFEVPPNVPMTAPMAFPPGDSMQLFATNQLNVAMYGVVRFAGYLGAGTTAERETACQ